MVSSIYTYWLVHKWRASNIIEWLVDFIYPIPKHGITLALGSFLPRFTGNQSERWPSNGSRDGRGDEIFVYVFIQSISCRAGEGALSDLTHRPSSSPDLATSLNCRRCRRRRQRCRRRKVVVVVDFRHHFNPVVASVVARSFLGPVPAGR